MQLSLWVSALPVFKERFKTNGFRGDAICDQRISMGDVGHPSNMCDGDDSPYVVGNVSFFKTTHDHLNSDVVDI